MQKNCRITTGACDGQKSERVNGDTNGEPLAHAAQGGMEGDGWMSDVEEGWSLKSDWTGEICRCCYSISVLLLSAEELFLCCCYRCYRCYRRRRCAVGFAELSTFLVAP